MPYDYIANPRHFLYAPDDPGYSSDEWVRRDDPTHPFVRYVAIGTNTWRKGLKWVAVATNTWKPTFDASTADCGPNSCYSVSHCNASPATAHPPTYGADADFVFVGPGTTLQVQVQWLLDGSDFGSVQTFATGPGDNVGFTTGQSSTPTTAGTGVDDGGTHVWNISYRIQLLDGSWTSWANGVSVSTPYQPCGRAV